jgi:hypothetical protein
MQSLTEMSRRNLINDIQLVNSIENHLKGLSNEIEEERLSTGKVNHQKLKVLMPFYVSAKERFSANIEKLETIEKSMDRELLYGSNVFLKDPQARERVRNSMLSIMQVFHEKALGSEAMKNEHEETKELVEEEKNVSKETFEISEDELNSEAA